MTDDDCWALERRFWLEGPAFYRERLAPECLMALPVVGILRVPEVLEGLTDAPRWQTVEISDRSIAALASGVRVLAYRAAARRAEDEGYRCWCTSTYRQGADDDRWRLIQHQQTPIDDV